MNRHGIIVGLSGHVEIRRDNYLPLFPNIIQQSRGLGLPGH
jgi:hypothetical protein